MLPKRFEGLCALVTGGASGIGKAVAERLAAEGAGVVVADIDVTGAAQTATGIATAHGVAAYAVAFDAASGADCARLVGEAVTRLGRLDVVVNNAGVNEWFRADEYPDERFERVLRINLFSVFHVCKAALPHLLASRGCIVNMSSAAAFDGVPYAAAYAASKAGVNGLTRSLAVEFADRGVRVNAVCPGAVDTPLNRVVAPLPEWADRAKIARLAPKTRKVSAPEEIAAAVAYLASAEACNVTGTTLSIDGGQTA